MATEPKGILGRVRAEVTPGNLKKTFFCLGGAEANEKPSRLPVYIAGNGRSSPDTIHITAQPHGAIALTGDPRRLSVEPVMLGLIHLFDPYCYRCNFGCTPETCHRECITLSRM